MKVWIGGVDYTEYVDPLSLTIIDKIQARSTASFSMNIPDIISEGQEVIIEREDAQPWEDNREFGGTIEKITRVIKGPSRKLSITCVDYNQVADRVLFANSFDEEHAGIMVEQIFYQKLAAEGITLGHIESGPVTSRSVFDWLKVSQSLDEIEQKTGIHWNIDFHKQLHFFSNAEFPAPWDVNETDDEMFTDFSIDRTREKYRNVQVFRPGDLETAEQVLEPLSPSPDGNVQSFFARFRLARKPRLFYNGVEIPPEDIGINGLEENKKWYWGRGTNVVFQDRNETPLPAGSFRMTYTGLFRRVFVAESQDEINHRKSIEGGTTGRYERYDDRANVGDRDAVDEFMEALFRKHGVIPNIASYNTVHPGLRAGMIQQINLPNEGIVGEFLIQQVTARMVGPFDFLYTVKLVDGEVVGGWVDYFKDITLRSRYFTIREDEYVSLVANFREPDMQGMDDSVQAIDGIPPFQALNSGAFMVCGRGQCLNVD